MKDSLRRLSLVLALACFGGLAAGCVGTMEPLGAGDDDDTAGGADAAPGGGGQTAAQLFEANVKTAVDTTCGACHKEPGLAGAPPFLGTGPADYYTKITADTALLDLANPANSKLASYTHAGPGAVFSATDKPKVVDWITKYAAEKAGQ